MIILYIIIVIFLMCLLAAVNYSGYVCFKDYNVRYNFKAIFLFHSIILEGSGIDGNIDINIKILFLRKKFNLENKSKKDKNMKKSNSFNILDILEQINTNKKYIMRLLYKIKPNYFKIEGEYGFYDPSITGTVTGFLYMIKPVFKNIIVNIKPNFLNQVMDIKLEMGGIIRPISLIRPILKLVVLIIKVRKNSISKLKYTKQKFKVNET